MGFFSKKKSVAEVAPVSGAITANVGTQKELSPCQKGSSYFNRIVKGQTQRVICPSQFYEQRQQRQIMASRYKLQKVALEQKQKRQKVITSMAQVGVPVAGLAGVSALGRSITGVAIPRLAREQLYRKIGKKYGQAIAKHAWKYLGLARKI